MTSNEQDSDKSNATYLEWPRACLQKGEDLFITVCCGNSFNQFALHKASSAYEVFQYWKTAHINDDEFFSENDLVGLLDLYLNNYCRTYIFGSDLPSSKAATEEAKRRGFDISVYIIGSDKNEVKKLTTVFSAVPSRIFLFQRKDFFTEDQGMYATMGMDRLAALRGAAAISGFPALVIDGGTMLTYTGSDSRGHIIGGGIAPGLKSRFRAMHSDAPALPEISMDEVKKRINRAIFSNLPIPLFARDTRDAMIVHVLSEVRHALDYIIQMWLQRTNDSVHLRVSRTVFLTGGAGDILLEVLGTNREKIIDLLKNEGLSKAPFKLDLQKCLVHRGMASVIIHNSERIPMSQNAFTLPFSEGHSQLSDFALSFLNKRVAKLREEEYVLGTVSKITQEDLTYMFHISYDSKSEDKDKVELTTLRVLLENYKYSRASKLLLRKRKRNDSVAVSIDSDQMLQLKPKSSPEKDSKPKDNPLASPRALSDNKTQETPIRSPREISEKKSMELPVRSPRTPRAFVEKKSKDYDEIVEKSCTTKNKLTRGDESGLNIASEPAPSQPDIKGAKKLCHRPHDLIKLRVMKYFIDQESGNYLPFFGTIDAYEFVEETGENLWHITYDDGDMEHCGYEELWVLLKQYKKSRHQDPQLRTRV